MTAHIQQLHHIDSLCSGMEWVTACPDLGARDVLLRIIGEEVGAIVRGVVHAVETKTVGSNPPGEESALR
ncbi:hypothetical protein [Microbulbifer variabilis]|uniref:hypothetical protein n=1 Tax=Microbulbifer variabilis TaxID=266805 RepID=UPI001CFC4EF9|nr:hypothetical protein [Microbulbifer variabilis]